ncbi:MAG TPA: ABC transporter substrate-binding protein [Polyangiaceae bacterium]|nr:ABC transporter substrate-binding protein [Polyangiaceae bacterium]
MGRIPYGGRLRLGLPWPILGLDPASLSDGFSALFASAVFDPLYGLDTAGNPYPTLADALPTKLDGGSKVTLRPGLKSGSGRPLTADDVVSSVGRARARGAAGVLGELDDPRLVPADALSVVFSRSAPDQVARALASPLVPLVPRGFSPLTPDGTGAFRVELRRGRATFTRNPNAARGSAFLDSIEVTAVSDLAELLRSFESGASDVGWFGTGLYRVVKDAVGFEAPRYAFAVLLSGKQAGAWGAPGALQPLLDAVPAQQLAHLGLRALPAQALGTARWGGPATNIAVQTGAPQLVAVARALGATLSTPGHELTVVERNAEELGGLRDTRQFGLMLDLVRAGPTPREVELALRTAASPEAAKRAPKTASLQPRELGRQLALGVIGELSVYGARRASLVGLESWQLGAVWTRKSA